MPIPLFIRALLMFMLALGTVSAAGGAEAERKIDSLDLEQTTRFIKDTMKAHGDVSWQHPVDRVSCRMSVNSVQADQCVLEIRDHLECSEKNRGGEIVKAFSDNGYLKIDLRNTDIQELVDVQDSLFTECTRPGICTSSTLTLRGGRGLTVTDTRNEGREESIITWRRYEIKGTKNADDLADAFVHAAELCGTTWRWKVFK